MGDCILFIMQFGIYNNTLANGFGIDFLRVFLNSIFSSINEIRTSNLFHSIEHLYIGFFYKTCSGYYESP